MSESPPLPGIAKGVAINTTKRLKMYRMTYRKAGPLGRSFELGDILRPDLVGRDCQQLGLGIGRVVSWLQRSREPTEPTSAASSRHLVRNKPTKLPTASVSGRKRPQPP